MGFERQEKVDDSFNLADFVFPHGYDLYKAKFQNADLTGANLMFVDLQNAILTGADLKEANLQNANLTGVKYDRSGKYKGIRLDGCYGNQMFVRHAKDQAYLEEFQTENPKIYKIWEIFSDCGRSLWR